MTRVKRSREELMNASDHLYYELSMFTALAKSLASGAFGEGSLNNALLESFTIHTRVLLDFLYSSKNPKSDDVIAEDFISADKWQAQRPPKSGLLQGIHRRVGKEIAHLTYARQQVTPETKPWRFVEITKDVTEVINSFLRLVPKDLLGKRWVLNQGVQKDA